ncbi:hypothetical protein KAU08_04130, partial [bacterium]|nr:hypothetical protein [bacterium]
RVAYLEKPTQTSPLFSKVGWPMLVAGIFFWLIELFMPGSQFILTVIATIGVLAGIFSSVMSFISEHSEGVEGKERVRLIRERTGVARCLYLEGKVPDGRGLVGRCRLYDFDMINHPYCIYCGEYSSSEGKPDV